jgi:hypothetical protein
LAKFGGERSGFALHGRKLGAFASKKHCFIKTGAKNESESAGEEVFLNRGHGGGFGGCEGRRRGAGAGGDDGGGDRDAKGGGSKLQRVSGEVGGQADGSDGDATSAKKGAERFDGAGDSLLRGVV